MQYIVLYDPSVLLPDIVTQKSNALHFSLYFFFLK